MREKLEQFIRAKTGLSTIEAATTLSVSQRAMIAARFLDAYRDEKSSWMRRARAAFVTGAVLPCAICGKYESVVQAHHIFPLYLQFACDVEEPDHSYEWLCPTHHAAVHRHIDFCIANVAPSHEGFPPEERDLIDKMAARAIVAAFT